MAQHNARHLLAASSVSLGGISFTGPSNETGIGRQCIDYRGINKTDLLNNTWYQLNCISTYTVDSQIFTTMWTTAVVGFLCLAVFCWGQSFVSVYRGRLLSPNVALKPPVLTGRDFWSKYFGWLWVTLAMSENELLATAGMDALMFERLIVFCLQFMVPVMVVAVSVLIPIHVASEFMEEPNNSQFAVSNLMSLTMGNLKPGATILWVHFVLVVLFTAYGMWLLDQHYKSYVLLRQQYLTRGDTVSAWLGNTPRQRPLASHGSMLVMDHPTQEVLTNPLWTFARAKASDSDTGTGATTRHVSAAGGPAAAAADGSGVAGTEGRSGQQQQGGGGGGGAVLTKLVSMQRSGAAAVDGTGPDSQRQQQRQQSAQQLRAYALPDLDGALPVAPPRRTSSSASPFADLAAQQQEQELLLMQPQPTLPMVQLSDIVFPAPAPVDECSALGGEQHSTVPPLQQQRGASSAAAAGGSSRDATASPSDASSAANSRLASRQSSGRALLTPKHVDSSAQPAAAAAAAAGLPPFGQPRLRVVDAEAATAAAGDAGGDEERLHSAAGAVPRSGPSTSSRRQRFAPGCAPGCTWRRVSCRSTASTDDDGDCDAPGVSFAEDADVPEAKRMQRRAAKRAAEAAAAAVAAKQLGADEVWWEYKTGDLLLDRHVVQVDMDKEYGDSAHDPDRPYYWWQLAPTDAGTSAAGETGEASSSGTGAAASPASPTAAAASASGGSSGSNIQPVPYTSLLFDKRSLRARRPSVRFRNTVHVRGQDGSLVPLHVSTYAVLVTDVPDPDLGLSERSSSCGVDFAPGRTLCGPFAEGCSSLLHMLDHALQFACWGWPCLLSRADLTRHAKGWSHASLKSTHSMILPDAEQQLAQLEAGTLLRAAAGGPAPAAAGVSPAATAVAQQQWQQRKLALSMSALERPTPRQRLVELTFRHLFPGEVQAVIPAQEYKTVNELLREWNRKTQVYVQTAALLELKNARRQARKKKQEAQDVEQGGQQQQQAVGGAEGDAGGGGRQRFASKRQQRHRQQQRDEPAEASQQQVCIEVTRMQQKGAHASSSSASAPAAGTPADLLGVGDSAAVAAATAPFVNGDPDATTASSSSHPPDGLQPASQHPGMARPRPRRSTGSTSDLDLYDDSDEELGCCAAMAQRLCFCACCGVGAIQDGGHGLLPPPGDEDLAGTGSRRRCWGLFGRSGRHHKQQHDQQQQPKKPAKDVLAEQRGELLELEAKIRVEQKKVLAGPDTGNFIVLFKTPQAANLAAHSTVYPHTGEVEAFKVQPAPSPEDVLWPSLWASPADRRSVLGIVMFWYAILYLIPTGFFAASLNAITLTMCSSSEFGKSFGWMCTTPFMQFLLTIVAPFVLLMVWQNAVIPGQMYRLELRRAVAVSLSEMERRILLTYCGWELINLFLGGVLSGSFVSQVQLFFRHPEQWAQVLGAAIPQTSNFFLNYVITRAFMMNFVRLLMPHGGMWRWIGQMLFTGLTGFRHAATASYRACIIYPASIRYGREPGLVLLILLIGMAYCVAAPLITVFVFAYMLTAYLVWRYQIIYVCTRAYESGGKMWPAYFLCITWCLGFFVAFTSSMLIFKKANAQGVLVLILLPLLYVFSRRCRQRYCSKVDHPPLWLAHTAPRSEIDPLVYLPPCLQPNAQGWFFEAGKPWVRWGVPSYNNPKKPGHDDGSCFC